MTITAARTGAVFGSADSERLAEGVRGVVRGQWSERRQSVGLATTSGVARPVAQGGRCRRKISGDIRFADRVLQGEVIAQLVDLRRRAAEYARRDGRVAEDEFFYAEQNARLARNAEEYYRSMFQGRVSSWNLRDRHMVETLVELVSHLDRTTGRSTKVVLWAHNSHLGDARATEMGERGELNLGQLVRERHGSDAVLVGFTTYDGTVTAAADWDAPAEQKRVRPALP